jgi:hypothetical protein
MRSVRHPFAFALGLGTRSAADKCFSIGTQKRSIYWFSACSDELKKIQETMSYDSDFWVEMSEAEYRGFKRRPTAIPHQVKLTKSSERYNLDEIAVPEDAKAAMPPVEKHTSFSTRMPYSSELEFELANRATLKGLTSKYWISPIQMRKKNWTLKDRFTQTSILQIRASTKVLNASHLEDPASIIRKPLSGATKKQFLPHQDIYRQLVKAIEDNGYSTGVFFTRNQLNQLNLLPAVDAVPVEPEASVMKFYNLSQFSDWEKIDVKKYPADQHCFFSGEVITSDNLRDNLDYVASQFPVKVWVSNVESSGLTLKPSAEPVKIYRKSLGAGVGFYNLDQLQDPLAGKISFGTMVR